MYIHHHRGIIPPPIPWGGGGNTGHGTIYIFSFRVNEYVGAHPRFQLGHGRELGAILQVCFLGR